MKIWRPVDNFNVKLPVLTSGTFDGVHLGHQSIIKRLKEIAMSSGGETVLLTYEPHPRLVLYPDEQDLRLLTTIDEKVALLTQFGIQNLVIYPFTKEFSRLSSLNFIRDILVKQLHINKLVIGYNHHFGRNREGSFEHLTEFGPLYGFDVEEISAKDVDSVEVSSTKIRNALAVGDIKTANAYLGYTYSLTGKVVKGKQLGRELGYPTANIAVNDKLKLIPAIGIYVVQVKYKDGLYGGMMSIGNNPTVGGKEQTIEVNIFDFNGTIYDEEITVLFIDKLRNEEKYDGLEPLKKQLAIDKLDSLAVLKNTI